MIGPLRMSESGGAPITNRKGSRPGHFKDLAGDTATGQMESDQKPPAGNHTAPLHWADITKMKY